MDVNEVEFMGTKCMQLCCGDLSAIVTTEVGPRIVSFGRKNGKNHLATFAADFQRKNADEYVAYGGHRLWTSPEDKIRTYEHDSKPVKVAQEDGVVTFSSQRDEIAGVRKKISLSLTEDGLDIVHTVINESQWQIELSLWGITQMQSGGLLVIPQNAEDTGLLPDRNLVFWSYTDIHDERLYFGNDYITLYGDPKAKTPLKIGQLNKSAYAAYFNFGEMFVKSFFYDSDGSYPDYGCNFESYSCAEFTEIESLTQLERIDKGCAATGYEHWSLFGGVKTVKRGDEKAIRKILSVYSEEEK